MGGLVFKLNRIAVGYDQHLFSDFSAEVREGETILLVGKNGAGKSTFLDTLKGVRVPLSGEIGLFGNSLTQYSAEILSRKIAVVNTSRPGLIGWSVTDLLDSTRSSAGEAKYSPEELSQINRLCGIENLLDRLVDQLSDGEFQKVMIARAICQRTPVIILDEPTAFLDVIYRRQVQDLFKELKAKFNTTLILSSHNFEHMLEDASQVWVLANKTIRVCSSEMRYEEVVEMLK